MKKLNVGVIGCGKISGIYLSNLTGPFAGKVTVSAAADLLKDKAETAAIEFRVPRVLTVDEFLSSPDVDIVLNLTQPATHYEVAAKAVAAGKHVYNEKPLCVTREDAAALLAAADAKKLRVGCAPDTFLGAGIQTSRRLIDEGWIGKPVAAVGFMLNRGPEHWHPAPEFYYKTGGGPLFDMGPYYLTALVSLLGPVMRVSGSAQKRIPQRVISSEPLKGTVIDVDVPTHIAGTLDFANGVTASLITSFDVYSHHLPELEIYGTEGTIRVPDPNFYKGPVLYKRGRAEAWSEIPLLSDFSDNSRGLGVVDMAEAIISGKPHRASGKMAYHVLDVMHGIHDASESGRYYEAKSTCERPAALGRTIARLGELR